MKKRSLAEYLLQKDALYNRIDLHRAVAHVLSLVVIVWWSLAGASDAKDFLMRGIVSGILVVIGRLVLGRLGASRLAAVIIVSVSLVLVNSLALSEIMLINTFGMCVLLLQEYLISPKKHIALGIALLLGAIIGVANGQHEALLTLVVVMLLARVASYVVQRQLSKKTFILFGFKAVCMMAIIWGLSAMICALYEPSFTLPSTVPQLHVPLWLGIILMLFAVRGLWVTLLLKTKRSPRERALRLFYIGLAIMVFAVAEIVSRYGQEIFLPSFMAKLALFGFVNPSMVVGACGVLAASLLVSAGIDRSLLLSNHRARSVATRLGLVAASSPNKVSHKE